MDRLAVEMGKNRNMRGSSFRPMSAHATESWLRMLAAVMLALIVTGVAVVSLIPLPPPPATEAVAERELTNGPWSDLDAIFSPDGKKIAFSSNRLGTFDIWVMDSEGRHQARLTSLSGDERHPQFSSDGKKIVFFYYVEGGVDLWMVNLDGSDLRNLTGDSSPKNVFELALTGGLIVYDAFKDGKWSLWLTDIERGFNRRIPGEGDCYDPSWSQNGKGIIFVTRTVDGYSLKLVDVYSGYITKVLSTQQKIRSPKLLGDDRVIFLMNTNGFWSIFATDLYGEAMSNLLEPPPGGLISLSWKPIVYEDSIFQQRPNSSEIVLTGYSTDKVVDLFLVRENGTIEMTAGAFAIEARGTIIERLTKVGYNAIPSMTWSPDGSRIIFSVLDDSGLARLVIKHYTGVPKISFYNR